MRLDKLMFTLPILQEQFDTLLAFDASPNDLNNGIINSAFLLLFKDFVKLYIAYQSAINRLLELYFSVVQVKRAKELLDAYKKFLVRMDKVNDFITVVDSVGLDKSLMPNLSRAPTSMSLRLLEKHIEFLESSGCKRGSIVALEKINGGTSSTTSTLRRQSSSTIELPDYIQSILATPNKALPSPGHNGYGLLVRSGSINQQQHPNNRRRQRQRSLQSTPMHQQDLPLDNSGALISNGNGSTSTNSNYGNPLCADLLSPLAVARLTCYKQKQQHQRRLNELNRLDAQFEELLEREGESEISSNNNNNNDNHHHHSLSSHQSGTSTFECDTVVEQDSDEGNDYDYGIGRLRATAKTTNESASSDNSNLNNDNEDNQNDNKNNKRVNGEDAFVVA